MASHSKGLNNNRGSAILFALMFVIMFTLAAVMAVRTGQRQNAVTEVVVGARVRNYYKAWAGLVDARERIQNNKLLTGWSTLPPDPAGFTNPLWPSAPVSYCIDIESDKATVALKADGSCADSNADVKVTISNQDSTTNLRTITCASIGN